MKKKLYDFYVNTYDLEQLNLNISNKLVVFLIYDEEYYYYLNGDSLLEMDEDFNILEVINTYNKQYGLKIINFYPVCFCNKSLVIALRTDRVVNSKLCAVKYNFINNNYYDLINYHRVNFSMLFVFSNIEKEINMSKKYIKRYKFHDDYIKRYILTEKKRKKKEFNELLNKLIPNKESIIDVSCGDNLDIYKIALDKEYETIVLNDICLNYLNTHNNNDVIITNDNIELNRIRKDSYDVSFCKNTLHHMNNLTNINNALKFLDKISREIIIVEIANPRECRGIPRFLNKYLYVKFLRDVGNCYLNREQFNKIINTVFDNHKVEYMEFDNILGTYMIAKISKDGFIDENKS